MAMNEFAYYKKKGTLKAILSISRLVEEPRGTFVSTIPTGRFVTSD
jgi:hypothetical protein